MTHGHHRGRPGPGRGCRPGGFRRRFGDREQWLERLEQYQRDLEQETADVADLIRRLKQDPPAAPTAEPATGTV
ncbi:MAG: hypothetical protein AB7V42_01555 [Thermoleophilia bacterium]